MGMGRSMPGTNLLREVPVPGLQLLLGYKGIDHDGTQENILHRAARIFYWMYRLHRQ
jgi:hypothetical protein